MKHSKILQRVAGTALAAACLASVTIPASADFEVSAPEEPMSVESNNGTRYLTTTSQRAASEIPLILGINVVGGNLFNGAVVMAGTDINDNPDPYIWNYNFLYPGTDLGGGQLASGDKREGYEDFDQSLYYEHGISSGTGSAGMENGSGLYASGGANQVMSGAYEELGGVSYGVYHMIDVWIGFNAHVLEQIDFIQNEMDPNSEYYQEGYATYDPLITDMATGTVTSRAYAWVEVGNALSAYLAEHPNLAARYGDPKTLCYNIQEFAFGIPYYIDSLIESEKLTKIKGVCINATTDDGQTFTAIDPATVGDVKADAYAVGNTVDWLTGDYTMKDLINEGVGVIVIYTAGYSYIEGGNGPGGGGPGGGGPGGGRAYEYTLTRAYLEGLMEEIGVTAEQAPVIIDAANESVTAGSNGYNYAPTTPLYVPYITAYMYLDQLTELGKTDPIAAAINPTAMFEYACDEFFHIKDADAYGITQYWIGTNWDATDSDLDKVPVVAEGEFVYDKAATVEAIRLGIQFALENVDNESVYLNGAYRQGECAYVLAHYVTDGGYDSFADLLKDKVTIGDDGNPDYSEITFDYENNGNWETLDITALVSYYGVDGLAELVDDYVAHMDNHPWQPNTSIVGTYGFGLGGETEFNDVADDAFYADAVTWAVTQGVTVGTGNGNFSPLSTCTRAEIVTFLYRAAGSPAVDVSLAEQFSDVSLTAFYAKAVAWAVEYGIAYGTGNDQFSPLKSCSRAEIVSFLWRFEGKPSASGNSSFSDVAATAFYAEAAAWAVENGITYGTGGNAFTPLRTCTRAEAVSFLYRDLV